MTRMLPKSMMRKTRSAEAMPQLAQSADEKRSDAPTPIQDSPIAFPIRTPESISAGKASIVRNTAAGAAHDLVTLLCAMSCNLDVLTIEVLSPAGTDAVRSLRAEASYLRSLARELRNATADSGDRTALRETHLAAWWPEMSSLLQAVHGDDVIIFAQIPRNLPLVGIKPDHLTQVVLNLVGNAAHAITELQSGDKRSRKPVKSAKRHEVSISIRLAKHSGTIDLKITDKGTGMSPEVLARACEPLFTTRAARGGTGLGLAMVQRLVGEAGGCVRIESTLGVGTTVTVELPIRAEREVAASLVSAS